MSWITPEEVMAVFPDLADEDHDYLQALIDHVQGLAEIVIGAQTAPDAGLKAVTTQIVLRVWRGNVAASSNPAGHQSESVEDYSYSDPTGAQHSQATGLGLTNREKTALRSAVGRTGLWVQPTTRGDVETAPRDSDLDDWLEGALPE